MLPSSHIVQRVPSEQSLARSVQTRAVQKSSSPKKGKMCRAERSILLTPTPLPLKDHQKLNQKFQMMILLIVLTGTILLSALPVLACGGVILPGDVFLRGLIQLPVSTAIASFGTLPLVIIPLESWILHQRECMPVARALRLVLIANLAYAIIMLFAAAFGVMPFPVIGGIFSAALAVRFIQPVGVLKNLGRGGFVALTYGLFTLIDLLSFFIRLELRSASHSPVLMFGVASVGLLVGFIFSYVVKGYSLRRVLRGDRPSLASTVFSMQVVAFLVTAIVALALVPFNRGPLIGM